MESINHLNHLISLAKDSLVKYNFEAKRNPGSLFYRGLVKNTKEYIEELTTKLSQEKEIEYSVKK